MEVSAGDLRTSGRRVSVGRSAGSVANEAFSRNLGVSSGGGSGDLVGSGVGDGDCLGSSEDGFLASSLSQSSSSPEK